MARKMNDIMQNKLNEELFREVTTFVLGTPEYQQKKNNAIKIQRLIRKLKMGNDEIFEKGEFLRNMSLEYTDQMLFRYPTFARDKLAYYNSGNIELPEQPLTKRSEVLKWIRLNIDADQLYLVGF